MTDPRYNLIRGILSEADHPELGLRSCGRLIEVEVGVNDNDGLDVPTDKTHVGVRMPGGAKPPADVRPIHAYDSDGSYVGCVKAIRRPEYDRQDVGAIPQFEMVWVGQRIYPSGQKEYFNSESEAKKYVANGDKLKWHREDSPDPWESVGRSGFNAKSFVESASFHVKAVIRSALAEARRTGEDEVIEIDGQQYTISPDGRMTPVGHVGPKVQGGKRPGLQNESEEDEDNPWAICHAELDVGEDSDKFERCVRGVKKKTGYKKESLRRSRRRGK